MKPLSEIIEAQKSQKPKLGIQIIDRNSIDFICKCTGFDYETLKQSSREQHYAFARNIIFDHLRQIGFSFNEIGLIFNRSHATVMHGIEKKNTFLELKDPLFLTYYNRFRKNYYQLVIEAFEIFMSNDFNLESDGE